MSTSQADWHKHYRLCAPISLCGLYSLAWFQSGTKRKINHRVKELGQHYVSQGIKGNVFSNKSQGCDIRGRHSTSVGSLPRASSLHLTMSNWGNPSWRIFCKILNQRILRRHDGPGMWYPGWGPESEQGLQWAILNPKWSSEFSSNGGSLAVTHAS